MIVINASRNYKKNDTPTSKLVLAKMALEKHQIKVILAVISAIFIMYLLSA